ncbi:MAG: hypothetical protein IH608_11220, partial [Proteobacteria bacterium]|nr:hypothetical protein [Pseudomonadota bacterium]
MQKIGLGALAAMILTLGPGAPAQAAGDWQFEFTPYVWFVGIDGSVDMDGRDVDFDYSFSDIKDHTDMGAEGLAVIQYKKWVGFVQGDYLSMSQDNFSNSAADRNIDKVTVDWSFLTLAAGYQFPTLKDSWIDVMVGGRFVFARVQMDTKAGNDPDRSETISDAILVLRP